MMFLFCDVSITTQLYNVHYRSIIIIIIIITGIYQRTTFNQSFNQSINQSIVGYCVQVSVIKASQSVSQ